VKAMGRWSSSHRTKRQKEEKVEKERIPGMVVNLLAWLIVGGVAGWLASRLAQGVGMGMIGDIIVGIVVVLIGGFVLSFLAPGTFALISFNVSSLAIAFIGAVILLVIVKLFRSGESANSSVSVTFPSCLSEISRVRSSTRCIEEAAPRPAFVAPLAG